MPPQTTPNHRICRRTSPVTQQASPKIRRSSPKPIEILHKCGSEPLLFPPICEGVDIGKGCRNSESDEGGWFFRLHTMNDLFLCPSEHVSSPQSLNKAVRMQGHEEQETKVVIKVTVERSPGPVRTLVKLGTSVEDTIKLVIQKYTEEGRTPHFNQDSASSFDLHVSHFSLQSLDRSNTIGAIGSRSFYLRRGNQKRHAENTVEVVQQWSSIQPRPRTMAIFLSFITRKVSKIMRRMRKLLKVFGCLILDDLSSLGRDV